MADTGRDLLILKAATAIAGAQANSISIDNSPVDVSTIAGAGWRTLGDFAGNRSMDLSVNGVWTDDVMRDVALDATDSNLLLTDITVTFADTASLSGDFYLASYEETGEHDGAVMFTMSLQSAGVITHTTAA